MNVWRLPSSILWRGTKTFVSLNQLPGLVPRCLLQRLALFVLCRRILVINVFRVQPGRRA